MPLLADPRALEALLVVLGHRVRAEATEAAVLDLPHLGLVQPHQRTAFALAAAASARPGLPARLQAESQGQAPAPSGSARALLSAGLVRVIPVHGELVSRGIRAEAMSGDFVGYDEVADAVTEAVEDPTVRGVVLDLDTPGGEVAGSFEAADAIREASSRGKPVVALANHHALSGGYLLASACSMIMLPRTGSVGSVGVYAAHVDVTAADAAAGLRYTFVSAGTGKIAMNPHAPLSDEGRQVLQRTVERTYQDFTAAVAARRGLSEDRVRELGARTYHGQEALDAGLADALGGLSAAVELAGRPPESSHSFDPGGRRARAPFPAHERAASRRTA